MVTTIIGIDCATKAKKIGLAVGYFDNKFLGSVEQARIGSKDLSSVASVITGWIKPSSNVLLALDAPLGWPVGLVQALSSHEAGRPIDIAPDNMFRRLTDRTVKQEIGKQPLEVGANLIARTARAALELLQEVREQSGHSIPLAWKPTRNLKVSAIEVYPAATLKAYRFESSSKKEKNRQYERRTTLEFLQLQISISNDATEFMLSNDHALDAAICVLAGVDFLRSDVIEPSNLQTAKKEGWIWIKKPIGT